MRAAPVGRIHNAGMIKDAAAGSTDLAQWQVLTLRPAGQSQALLAQLRQHGARANNLPLLRLRPAGPTGVRKTLDAVSADARWLFTSPASARFLATLAPHWLTGKGPIARAAARGAVFAPGHGTAQALRSLDVMSVVVPETRFDSEGLLALPALRAPLTGELVLVGAPGGRDLLRTELARRGLQITPLNVYRRAPARLPPEQWHLTLQTGHLALLVSSGRMLERLCEDAPAPTLDHLRRHALLVTTSQRLATQANDAGFPRTRLARAPADADLVDALRSAAT